MDRLPEWVSSEMLEACACKVRQIVGVAPGTEMWMEVECDPKAHDGYASFYFNVGNDQVQWDCPQEIPGKVIVLNSTCGKDVMKTLQRLEENAKKHDRQRIMEQLRGTNNRQGVPYCDEEVGKTCVVKDIKGSQWWMAWTDAGKIFYAAKETNATTWERPPELKDHPAVEKYLAIPWQELLQKEKRKSDKRKSRHGSPRHRRADQDERRKESHRRADEDERKKESHRRADQDERRKESHRRADEDERRKESHRRADEDKDERRKESRHGSPRHHRRADKQGDDRKREERRRDRAHR